MQDRRETTLEASGHSRRVRRRVETTGSGEQRRTRPGEANTTEDMTMRPGSRQMLSEIATTLGREVHVYLSPASLPLKDEDGSSTVIQADDESDEFYEFTAEDYVKALTYRKQDDALLKTRKTRQEEGAARQARMTKATVRVQFPDNYVLEAVFQPSDPVLVLVDLLKKVISQPAMPFYLYATPPKQRLNDMQQTMYAAGLTPGALVYFSYDAAIEGQGDAEGAYLKPEIVALKDLHLLEECPKVHEESVVQEMGSGISMGSSSSNSESAVKQKKEGKQRTVKPKWFKQ